MTTVQSVATYPVSGIEHGGDYVSLNTARVEATKRRTEKKKGLTSKSTPLFEQNRSSVCRCFFLLLLLCLCVAVALSCSFDSCSATTWHGKKKNERKTLKQKNVCDSSSSQVTVSHHTNRKKKKKTHSPSHKVGNGHSALKCRFVRPRRHVRLSRSPRVRVGSSSEMVSVRFSAMQCVQP